MRAAYLFPVVAVALAACQKAPGASASATAQGAASPASTGALPHRRAGLWEQTMSEDGKPLGMGAMQMCVDAAVEAKASVFSHQAQSKETDHCSATQASRGLDGSYRFSSTCSMPGGATMSTKGTASGDFSTGYQVHTETDTSGATFAALNGHRVMDVTGKWLGPCPAGMVGGDLQLANGIRVNGRRLAGAAAALAGHASGAQ
jgi:hypothetical protein